MSAKVVSRRRVVKNHSSTAIVWRWDIFCQSNIFTVSGGSTVSAVDSKIFLRVLCTRNRSVIVTEVVVVVAGVAMVATLAGIGIGIAAAWTEFRVLSRHERSGSLPHGKEEVAVLSLV
jgi:hypothetical protein